MNKKLVGFLAVVMVLSLAACGGNNVEEKNSKEYVYKSENVDLNEIEDKNSISNFFLQDDKLYVVGYNWTETGRTLYILEKNLDGSDSSKREIKLEDNQYMNNFVLDDQGNFYTILNEYFEDSSDPENYIWQDNYYLIQLDLQGKEVWRQALIGEPTEEYYSVNWLGIFADGRIGVVDTSGITLYDNQGKLIKKSKIQTELSVISLYQLKDDSVLLYSYKSETNNYSFYKINIDTGELSEEYEVPETLSNQNFYPGTNYDFMLVNNLGVRGYNLGDAEATELMSFIDSDLNIYYIDNLTAVSDKEFYGLTNDALTSETALMKFIKVEPKDVVDKKIITLGSIGMNWEVRNQVVKFNKSNGEYRIQIKDYSQFNTEDDYEGGITKLNTDITSGKVPDILITDNNLPIDSYIAKGLIEDLYPYIDKDEELSKDNFFPNVLKAYETNGKLYQMVPSFTIFTVVGKTSEVGPEEGWTLADLNAIMETRPKDTMVFVREIRSRILDYSIQMSGEQFIDWKTGECKFDSQGFYDLLEFLKQFPEQYEELEEEDDNSFWRNYDALWRDGKALLSISYLDGFPSYNYMKKGLFGEDITMIGFPAENKKGSAIMPNLNIVMSSKSKHKDGAWEFMRFFLTDEYQDTIEYGWPLSVKRTSDLAKKAMEKPTYEDENGKLVEYDQMYYVGDVEIKITPMTQAEIDEVLKFVKSVEQPYSYDQNLINIINEETAPYFAGQKNIKEVADIIQNRIQIYVNENR